MKSLIRQIANNVESVVRKNIHNKNIGKVVGMGADGTPTKFIDKLAEKSAIETIRKSKVKVNLLSEEIGFIDNNADETIVLDPVDGTHNAVRGIPFYSVSIAVGRGTLSSVSYGLVRNLVNNDTYEGMLGKGAFLNGKRIFANRHDKNKKAIHSTDKKEMQDTNKKEVMYSVYLGKKASKNSYKVAEKPIRIRSFGCASLEMCLVASGALDLYYQSGQPLRVTDMAAGTLILREAGGEVYNIKKEILDLELSLSDRSDIIAVRNRGELCEIRDSS
ncbi:MAG: inositol monophosphatase family protein [Thermoplasmata archaeon]